MQALLEFAPLVAFFVAYRVSGLYAATAVLMVAMAILLIVDYVRLRRVPAMHALSAVLVFLFGTATLVLHDLRFIQWKPTILYWAFSMIFLLCPFILGRTLVQTMLGQQISLPDKVWGRLNSAWIIFFMFMGAVNLAAVHNLSCNDWVNFKFYGFTGLMLVFVVGQALFLARYVEEAPR